MSRRAACWARWPRLARLPRGRRRGPAAPTARIPDHRARRDGADHRAGGQGAVPVGGGRAGAAPLGRRPATTSWSASRRPGDARAHGDRGRRRGRGLGGERRRDRALGRRPATTCATSAQADAGRRSTVAGGAAAGGDGGGLGRRSGRALSLRRADLSQRSTVCATSRSRRSGSTTTADRLGRHARARSLPRRATSARARCRAARRSARAVLGMARTAAGTRVVAGNVNGDARLYALTLAGVEGCTRRRDPRVVALVERGGEAVLVAGPVGKRAGVRAARARCPASRFPPASLQFSALVTERAARWARCRCRPAAARRDGRRPRPRRRPLRRQRSHWASRAPTPGARIIAGSELVGDAERFTVACARTMRCLVVTDGPHAWQTDGDQLPADAASASRGGDACWRWRPTRRGRCSRSRARRRSSGLTITGCRPACARPRDRLAVLHAIAAGAAAARRRPRCRSRRVAVGHALDRPAGGRRRRRRPRLRRDRDRSRQRATPCSTARTGRTRRSPPRRCRCRPI